LRCLSPQAASIRHCAGGRRWLDYPLVALEMRRDGVSAAQLRAVVATAQDRLRDRLYCRSAACAMKEGSER
jgi:hypothetical protein